MPAQRPAVPSRTSCRQPFSAAATARSPRTLHVLRHGPSELNAYFTLHRYGSPHSEPLRDPLIYDAPLTRAGRAATAALAPAAAALRPPPSTVYTSPLSRCLETAAAAFGALGVPIVAVPGLRERLTLSSEVGRPASLLSVEFPAIDFTALPEVWWYTPPDGANRQTLSTGSSHSGGGSCDGVWASDAALQLVREPEAQYLARLRDLREWLEGRREPCVAIVSHWGVLRAVAGVELEPAGLASVEGL